MTSFNQPLLNDSIFFNTSGATSEVVSAADNVAGILVTAINLGTTSVAVLYLGAQGSTAVFLVLKQAGFYGVPFVIPAGERITAYSSHDLTIFYKVL